MTEKDAFELDGEENFIPSIFNYCDRWCERCPFTYREILSVRDLTKGRMNSLTKRVA